MILRSVIRSGIILLLASHLSAAWQLSELVALMRDMDKDSLKAGKITTKDLVARLSSNEFLDLIINGMESHEHVLDLASPDKVSKADKEKLITALGQMNKDLNNEHSLAYHILRGKWMLETCTDENPMLTFLGSPQRLPEFSRIRLFQEQAHTTAEGIEMILRLHGRMIVESILAEQGDLSFSVDIYSEEGKELHKQLRETASRILQWRFQTEKNGSVKKISNFYPPDFDSGRTTLRQFGLMKIEEQSNGRTEYGEADVEVNLTLKKGFLDASLWYFYDTLDDIADTFKEFAQFLWFSSHIHVNLGKRILAVASVYVYTCIAAGNCLLSQADVAKRIDLLGQEYLQLIHQMMGTTKVRTGSRQLVIHDKSFWSAIALTETNLGINSSGVKGLGRRALSRRDSSNRKTPPGAVEDDEDEFWETTSDGTTTNARSAQRTTQAESNTLDSKRWHFWSASDRSAWSTTVSGPKKWTKKQSRDGSLSAFYRSFSPRKSKEMLLLDYAGKVMEFVEAAHDFVLGSDSFHGVLLEIVQKLGIVSCGLQYRLNAYTSFFIGTTQVPPPALEPAAGWPANMFGSYSLERALDSHLTFYDATCCRRYHVLGHLMRDLREKFPDQQYINGVEIGVNNAISSQFLLKFDFVNLVGLDPFINVTQSIMQMSRDVFAQYPDRSQLLEMGGEKYVDSVEDGSLDFVFVDGDHSRDAVRRDFMQWIPKVRSGGLISGHDLFNPAFEGVLEAFFVSARRPIYYSFDYFFFWWKA